MSDQISKRRDYDRDVDRHQRDRRRSRSRSHSNSRSSRRHRNHDSRSRSRSRSRSIGQRRHRRRYSRSRSPSGSHNHHTSRRNDRYSNRNTSRRYDKSNSPSRTSPSSNSSRSKRNRRSRSNSINGINDKNAHRSQNSNQESMGTDLANLPLPKQRDSGAYYNLDTNEPIDKERIHREIEEKLRQTLAKEGKVYPPPKVEASHPVFANDGSFLEIFKQMQQAQQPSISGVLVAPITTLPNTVPSPYVSANSIGRPPPPPPPIIGRRRGGKILKTGMVAKQKSTSDSGTDPKDFWSLYLAEVNKYKSTACESDSGTRPLVK